MSECYTSLRNFLKILQGLLECLRLNDNFENYPKFATICKSQFLAKSDPETPQGSENFKNNTSNWNFKQESSVKFYLLEAPLSFDNQLALNLQKIHAESFLVWLARVKLNLWFHFSLFNEWFFLLIYMIQLSLDRVSLLLFFR